MSNRRTKLHDLLADLGRECEAALKASDAACRAGDSQTAHWFSQIAEGVSAAAFSFARGVR